MKSLVRPLEEPLFEKSSSLDYKKINNQPKEKKTMKKITTRHLLYIYGHNPFKIYRKNYKVPGH